MTKRIFMNTEPQVDNTQPDKEVLMYSKKYGGYIVGTKDDKIICVINATSEQYYNVLARNYKAFYPDFNPEKHELRLMFPNRGDYFYAERPDSTAGIPIAVVENNNDDTEVVNDGLPPGSYKVVPSHEFDVILKPLNMINSDKYIEMRGEVSGKLIYDDLKKFRDGRSLYEKEGVRHKRGVMLFGPPGNGKTREIAKILEKSKDDGLVSIFIPSSFNYLGWLDKLKEPMKGKDVVFVIEEMTERIHGRGLEDLLSFLDGEMSWNNSYVIATTNHPEEIPSNVIDRPGRFELVIEFGNPNKEEKMKYLQGRGYNEEEAKALSEMTEGLSLDYVAQLVTQSRVSGIDTKEYIKNSKDKRNRISKSFKPSMGIGRGGYDD